MDLGTIIHATHPVGPDLRLSPELEHRNHEWGLSRSLRYLWREGRKKGRWNGSPVSRGRPIADGGWPSIVISRAWGRGRGCRPGQWLQSTRCLDLFMLFIFQLGIFTYFVFVLKFSQSSTYQAEESTLEKMESKSHGLCFTFPHPGLPRHLLGNCSREFFLWYLTVLNSVLSP